MQQLLESRGDEADTISSYDDNDPGKAAPPAPTSVAQPPPAPVEAPKANDINGQANNLGGNSAENSYQDNNAFQGQDEEEEDDDDDVDFNLGGGGSGAVNTSASHNIYQDEAMSPPSHGGYQKSVSKEDG